MAIQAVVATATAAVYGAYQAGESEKKQSKAREIQSNAARKEAQAQRRIANIKAQRERTAAYRKQRQAAGTAIAQEQATGVSSTGVAGFTGGLQSQTASAVSAGQQITSIGEATSIFNEQASRQASQLFSSAAENATTAGYAQGIATVGSIFLKK